MKKMSKEERKKYIETKRKERETIQNKINQLRKERDKYVAAKRKEMAGENTLDEVVIKAVREQAKQKNYKFEEK
jgi:hypothetical protein